MFKIGILTHYHNTVNYGGALQAFALCKVIGSLGYNCEQIDVDCFSECRNLDHKPSAFKQFVKPILPALKYIRRLKKRKRTKQQAELRNLWRESFADFTVHSIPHTTKQYSTKNIDELATEYDVFVVGSDQVWNPIWYYEPFFLTFAPDYIPKIAYAASIAQTSLSEKTKQVYANHLINFDAISVREESSVPLLSDLSLVPVEYVLDPTLLLEREQWNELASKRLVQQPYVFCYFLGNDENMRAVALDFARRRGVVLANIQHATAHYHTADLNFGDVCLEAPSPNEFLSLIKNAEYVFTDSYHAMVFSFIFEKQFFVYERQNYSSMSARTKSFVNMLCASERFCNCEERLTAAYVESLTDIDYSNSFGEFMIMKEKSMRFLSTSLNNAKVIVEKQRN